MTRFVRDLSLIGIGANATGVAMLRAMGLPYGHLVFFGCLMVVGVAVSGWVEGAKRG